MHRDPSQDSLNAGRSPHHAFGKMLVSTQESVRSRSPEQERKEHKGHVDFEVLVR